MDSWCYEVCTYDGPISDISDFSGDASCTFCRGGLGSTNTSSGGGSSSGFTALDGLIANSGFLSDLSAVLDPDGMPLSYFQQQYPLYAYLVPKLRTLKQFIGDISREDLEYLVRNEEIIDELNTELAIDGFNAQAEAQLYLKSLRESAEFKDICSALNSVGGGGNGDPLKGIIVDLMVEGAQEWAENFLGINDLSALKNLIEKGIDKGGQLAFRATRIIARFIAKKNPVFNALNSFWKAKTVYEKVNKVYKVFDKFKDLPTNVMSAVIKTAKDKFGGILNAFEWVDDNTGGKIIGGGRDFFERLINNLGSNFTASPSGVLVCQLIPNQLHIVYNPSSSFGYQTIDIQILSPTRRSFKFRVD